MGSYLLAIIVENFSSSCGGSKTFDFYVFVYYLKKNCYLIDQVRLCLEYCSDFRCFVKLLYIHLADISFSFEKFYLLVFLFILYSQTQVRNL